MILCGFCKKEIRFDGTAGWVGKNGYVCTQELRSPHAPKKYEDGHKEHTDDCMSEWGESRRFGLRLDPQTITANHRLHMADVAMDYMDKYDGPEKIVAVAFEKVEEGWVKYDLCFTWETGQSMALEGYLVIASADDGHMSMTEAQNLYSAEHDRFVDCFGED